MSTLNRHDHEAPSQAGPARGMAVGVAGTAIGRPGVGSEKGTPWMVTTGVEKRF